MTRSLGVSACGVALLTTSVGWSSQDEAKRAKALLSPNGGSELAPAGAAPDVDRCIGFHADAQVARQDGHLRRARGLLRRCLHPACSALLRSACAELLDAVESDIPSIILSAEANGADLSQVSVRDDDDGVLVSRLDGRPLELDPGEHGLRFETPGYEPATRKLVLRVGEKQRVVHVTFNAAPVVVPAPPTESPSSPPLLDGTDYILLGASLAAGAVGAAIGLAVAADFSDAKRECAPDCEEARLDSIRRRSLVADSLFAVSAATLTVTLVRVVLRANSRRSAELAVEVGPNHLLLGGVF